MRAAVTVRHSWSMEQGNVTIGVTCTSTVVCEQYQPIADYLTAKVGRQFEIVPLLNDGVMFQAADAQSLTFMISNPTTFQCIQVQYGAGGVLSIVRNVTDLPTKSIGSGIVVLANNSDINSIHDLAGKRIATSRLTQLQGFQAQWGEFLAQGIPFFQTPAQLQLAVGGQPQLDSLLARTADVAFTGINQTVVNGPYRVINPMTVPGFPFPTSTRLYPESLLFWVGSDNDTDLLRAVQSSLLELEAGDPVLDPSMIWYFRSAYDYGTARTLLTSLNMLRAGADGRLRCLRTEDLPDIVSCTPGFTKLPAEQLLDTCQAQGIPCPPGSACLCNPCRPVPGVVLGLSVGAFSGFLVALCIVALCIAALVVRRIWSRVPLIPYAHLDLTAGQHSPETTAVLGIGRHGRVLRARYQGAEVTVQRAGARPVRGRHPHLDAEEIDRVSPDRRKPRALAWKLRQTAARACTWNTAYRRDLVAIEQLTRMRHSHLLPVLGACRGRDKCELLVVHGYCKGGTLHGLLLNPLVRLSTDVVLAIIADVATAMQHLHHGTSPPRIGVSLQPVDLYVTHEYKVLVRVRHTPTRNTSPWYCSPQILRGGSPDSPGDVYAFGMLLYEILYRQEPFCERLVGDQAHEELLSAITDTLADAGDSPPIRPNTMVPPRVHHEGLRALMERCWLQKPEDRPTFDEIFMEVDHQRPALMEDAMRQADRSKRAVQDFLPPHIADQLATTGRVEPKEYKNVTLLFTDIQGFVAISSTLRPQQV